MSPTERTIPPSSQQQHWNNNNNNVVTNASTIPTINTVTAAEGEKVGQGGGSGEK
jgi:hypothetical protein